MTDSKYPIFIVSKNRHDSMFTSRSLSRMKVPHYIVIEPQNKDNYEKSLDTFDIRQWATLIIAPFSDHGDGAGRARNYAWDISMDMNYEKHWVLGDNIADFYRLHKNQRIRVESSAVFKASEDFIDRFENVPISGFQYRFFVAPNSYYPPFVKNTRIYSCLLIDNSCKHRWRGRYNEDTDICLRVLKDGDCTIQFNAFLQGKTATQTMSGGNTEEFYHKESVDGVIDKSTWRDGKLNSEGTYKKSKMLYDLHPDVTTIVWKYDRWHHYVDYSSFKKNKLVYKKHVDLLTFTKIDNYNMKFISNYK